MEQTYGEVYRELYLKHWWWRSRAEFIVKTLRALPPSETRRDILDVGCGDGLFFERLAEFGNVEGLEPSAELVSESNPYRARIHVHPFDASFQPRKRYSMILMLDVLEHLPDPVDALKHVLNLLSPDGTAIITVPAFMSLWTNHDVLNHHFIRYTKSSFRHVAGQAGFRIRAERYFFHWTCPAKLAQHCVEGIFHLKPNTAGHSGTLHQYGPVLVVTRRARNPHQVTRAFRDFADDRWRWGRSPLKSIPPLSFPLGTTPSIVQHLLEDFTLCRCSSRDHCFTDLASVGELEQYEPDYFEREHRNWFLHPNLVLYAKLSRLVIEHKRDASVLDIGCGNGNFLRYLLAQSKSLSLTGIDMAPNAQTDGITYLQGDFLQERFARKFDVLVSLAVIEHISDVAAFAKRLSEICEPGGLVITMTVDERSLVYGAARALRWTGYSGPMRRLYSKHHLNHFTSRSLRRLLERHGLSTVQVIRHNSPMAAVDIPTTSQLATAVLRSGVWVGFQLVRLTQRTMLQTVLSKKSS